ncbi:MAG: hypothetical protein ACI93H_001098, partial [Psychromonas sp.]
MVYTSEEINAGEGDLETSLAHNYDENSVSENPPPDYDVGNSDNN